MPPRNLRLRVEDILEAIADVTTYVAGLTFEQFSADRKTTHAVLHNLQVIGEAARHIGDEVELRFPDVPWPEMRDMRNVLATSTSAWTSVSCGRRSNTTCRLLRQR